MADGSPVQRAKISLSGEGLRRRMDEAENRALNIKPVAPAAKKKKKPEPQPNLVKPQQKFVDARQQAIAQQQAADRAAIAAMREKQGLRRSN